MTKKVSLLYVEDDPDIRDIVKMALEDEGFTLTICESGYDALEKSKQCKSDVILMDVMMPGLDGPTTLSKLRENSDYIKTPVIFVTAKVQPKEIDEYLKLGALGIISKPFDPLTLADQINDLLNNKPVEKVISSVLNKLHKLQQQFSDSLPDRLTELRESWNNLDKGGKTSIKQMEFYRHIHSLAGSAATFGYQKLGNLAMEMEADLQNVDFKLIDTKQDLFIQENLQLLENLIKKGPDQITPLSNNSLVSKRADVFKDDFLVYVLEDDIALGLETVKQLKTFGYQIFEFTDLKSIKLALNDNVPDAFIIDISLKEGRNAGTDFAQELSDLCEKEIPIIFMSSHDSWRDRVNSVRAKGTAYMTKPIKFDELAEVLDNISGRTLVKPYRILIVDDTEVLAEHYAQVIQEAGMEAFVLIDPEQTLETLTEVNPDLLLLDLYMPTCNGIEVANVIRQHPNYDYLPIVYLSTENNIQIQLEALKAGGDDFLVKPIADDHLVAAVEIRAKRFSRLIQLMSSDSLTGLLNHINLKLSLERFLNTTQRRDGILAFAMLDIDNFKSINDQYGHPVGDRVIKSLARLLNNRLRKSDIAARYGGEEFAIIFPDTTAEQALLAMEELREIFAELSFSFENTKFNTSFSAGIASSYDCNTTQSLIVAADNAMYDAKENGRNQVVIYKP